MQTSCSSEKQLEQVVMTCRTTLCLSEFNSALAEWSVSAISPASMARYAFIDNFKILLKLS